MFIHPGSSLRWLDRTVERRTAPARIGEHDKRRGVGT
jgi:hypothetical protein